MPDSPVQPSANPSRIAGLCLLNWVIPGAGFVAAGDRKRGWLLVGLLNGIFFLGLLYSGAVFVPALSPRDPAFNVFGALAFLVQCLHGGGTALLILSNEAGGALGALFSRDPGDPYADLGAFHFFTAGALNYFATMRLFDLLRGIEPEKAAEKSEGKEGEDKAKNSGKEVSS